MRIPCLLFNTVLFIIFSAMLWSCGTSEQPANKKADTFATATTAIQPIAEDSLYIDKDDSFNYAIYYIAVADTGQDYYSLRALMAKLQKNLNWPIDTLGRYYNTTKNEIVIPDSSDDEMYRGEYLPRRGPDETMSLEYYNFYTNTSTEKNIALITGIFEQKHEADSMLNVLKSLVPHAFVKKSKVFVGCMH